MGKKLVLAVAGAGKTTSILNSVVEDRRSLIITYTNENLRSLEASLIKRFGRIPKNVTLMTYFSFLYVFCFRPFFSYKLRDNGYTWKLPVFHPGTPGRGDIRHYMTKGRYLYSNRVAKYVLEFGGIPKVIARLEEHFDALFVDEVQDFAASDFNLLLGLANSEVEFLLVGDFFQHTFDTSRDGQIRTNLHKKGLDAYAREFERVGFDVDLESLGKTHRCSPEVCGFITENVGIQINSHREDATSVVVVEDPATALELYHDDEKVKLFYQEHHRYDCRSNNWGKCKGINTYEDVCVVLNATTAKAFAKGNLGRLPESTRNKLYVACSRANGNLYILYESHIRSLKRT